MKKTQTINPRGIIYDLHEMDPDGFDREVKYRNGFNKEGLNRNKEYAVTEEKVKLALKLNPWKIYYAKDKFKKFYEAKRQCTELEPNT